MTAPLPEQAMPALRTFAGIQQILAAPENWS